VVYIIKLNNRDFPWQEGLTIEKIIDIKKETARFLVNDKPSCHPERSEGSHEILRAKALRTTLWGIYSNDNLV
jgi:hypothetical protein